MERDRQVAEEHYHDAIDLLASGENARAIDGFRAALAADATFLDAQHGLIRALQEERRFDEAIDAAKALAQIDPEDVLAYTALSILYQHKGMIAEAEEAALRAKLLGWKQQLRSHAGSSSPR